jgi:hypothetical protein
MKHKLLALLLALTVVSFAQTATQTAPSDPQAGASAEKKCACCNKAASADAKDAGQCERMKSADGKEMSCCGGKDAKSCMKGDKDKAAMSCCKDGCGKDKTASASCGKACGKECKNGGCSSNKSEKASASCGKHEARS